jgi:hypothetical protein
MDSKADKYTICRHIKASGHRCQSPAITGSVFCYFHRAVRHGHDAASTTKVGPLRPETMQYLLQSGQTPTQFAPSRPLNFPPLEDAESIQLNICLVYTAIAAGQIDPNVARGLLYALQVASCNLRILAPALATGQDASTLARRVVRTRDGQALAARGNDNGIPSQAPARESRFAEMLHDLLHPEERTSNASSKVTTSTE